MPSDVMRDVTLGEVTPRTGKGALGTWRVFGAVLDAVLGANRNHSKIDLCLHVNRGQEGRI